MKSAQKLVLLAIALYHLGFALMAILSEKMAAMVAKHAFGVTLDMSPQVMYLAKLVGIYGAIFGVFVIMIALNPVKYRHLVYVVFGLYVMRISSRLIFLPQVKESFQIEMPRIIVGAVLLTGFALAVLFVRPKAAPKALGQPAGSGSA
jgi:hypothetical protein